MSSTFQPGWLHGPQPPAPSSETEAHIDLPGVTVQSFHSDDADDNGGGAKLYNGFSISSVKATVESMRGPVTSLGPEAGSGGLGATELGGAGGRRITPTSRPPLSGQDYPADA